jgi:hypothetical protein
MHGVFADTQHRRQFAATPMGRAIAGFLAGSRQNPGPNRRGQHADRLTGMIGVEAIEAGGQKALLPANDRRCGGLEPLFDRIEGGPFGQHQEQLGAKHISGGQRTGLGDAAEFQLLIVGQ